VAGFAEGEGPPRRSGFQRTATANAAEVARVSAMTQLGILYETTDATIGTSWLMHSW
jgi:hypothetical protein